MGKAITAALLACAAMVACSSSGPSTEAEADKVRVIDAAVQRTPTGQTSPLVGDAGTLHAAIVEVPEVVEPKQRFSFVVELRNALQTDLDLTPCPEFWASFGESAVVATAQGRLPCGEIGTLDSGQGIRVRIPMVAPDEWMTGEADYLAVLNWRLGAHPRMVEASIPLRMSCG